MGKIHAYWVYLRSSLWFTPAVMVLGFVALGFWLGDAERNMKVVDWWPRVLGAKPQGSQAMLAAIATSIITVAGVVFSITIVAFAQASNQYSPRILRTFTSDPRNQVVLGFFVGVFAYCLVVLRTIAWDDPREPFPSMAIFVAFLLALASVGFLIFFIHHIAFSIQASTMVRGIATETIEVIQQMFPKAFTPVMDQEELADRNCEEALEGREWHPVPALDFGYVQRVEKERLFQLACEREIILRMEVGVGDFAQRNRPLVMCSGRKPDDKLVQALNESYGIDAHRTVDQDPGFGIQQLADVAVKALSPGINDTSTALISIDHISEILRELAERSLDPAHYFSGSQLRIIVRGISFPKALADALEPIMENARGKQAVLTHLLRCLERLADVTVGTRRECLLVHASSAAELVQSIQAAAGRQRLQSHADALLRSLAEPLDSEHRASL